MTTVVRTIHFAVKARRKRFVVGPEAPSESLPGRVPRAARLMALAIKYDGLLRRGVVADLSELAHLCQVTQPRMTQIMNLLHLAPDIQEEILDLPLVASGRDRLTERDLRPIAALSSWKKQRTAWRAIRPRCS
ncbi:MAG: hypothetical protein IT363_01915 [Methanoregulaceae archaeon]|nr:hypothetical protein [Methanoregulaceae archaeon]